MSVFFELLYKILPLYFSVFLGYIGGRFLRIKRSDITRLIFYMITPFIVFNGVLQTPLSLAVISLPLATYIISCSLAMFFYWISSYIWEDNSRNIIAYTAGSANTGYFGLPVAIMLFDNVGEGIYIVAFMGLTLFESTLGFYICAKGRFRTRDSLIRVATLPTVHAFILGVIFNRMDISLGPVFSEFMTQIKGTYSILGMMILGLGISALKHYRLDWKFIGLSFLSKFIAWPAAIFLLLTIDRALFGVISQQMAQALILIAIVPTGINTVIVATLLNAQPDKAATTVMLSTLFALFFVPFMVMIFLT
jgi:malate permease and related proteins